MSNPYIDNGTAEYLAVKGAFIDAKEAGKDKEETRLAMIRAGCPIASSGRLYGKLSRGLGYGDTTPKPLGEPSATMGRSSTLARSIYDWMEANPTAHKDDLFRFLDDVGTDSVRKHKRTWLRVHELVGRVHRNAETGRDIPDCTECWADVPDATAWVEELRGDDEH